MTNLLETLARISDSDERTIGAGIIAVAAVLGRSRGGMMPLIAWMNDWSGSPTRPSRDDFWREQKDTNTNASYRQEPTFPTLSRGRICW